MQDSGEILRKFRNFLFNFNKKIGLTIFLKFVAKNRAFRNNIIFPMGGVFSVLRPSRGLCYAINLFNLQLNLASETSSDPSIATGSSRASSTGLCSAIIILIIVVQIILMAGFAVWGFYLGRESAMRESRFSVLSIDPHRFRLVI